MSSNSQKGSLDQSRRAPVKTALQLDIPQPSGDDVFNKEVMMVIIFNHHIIPLHHRYHHVLI